jgi:type II secretory pathway pseudopilin PulG
VVLAIIGILAAIAIPNLLTAMQRSRQKRTMADMLTIGTAIETYRMDKGAYPTDVKLLGELPKQDGWTTPFNVAITETSYYIGSAGADKTFDRALPEYEPATGDNFDCDIIYANGAFVQQPASPGGTR